MPAKLLSSSFLTLALPWLSLSRRPFLFLAVCCRSSCVHFFFLLFRLLSLSHFFLFIFLCFLPSLPVESCIVAVCEFEERRTVGPPHNIKLLLKVNSVSDAPHLWEDLHWLLLFPTNDLTRSCFSAAELCPHRTVSQWRQRLCSSFSSPDLI